MHHHLSWEDFIMMDRRRVNNRWFITVILLGVAGVAANIALIVHLYLHYCL